MNAVRTRHVEVERSLVHVNYHSIWKAMGFSEDLDICYKFLKLLLQLCRQLLLDADFSPAD